MENFFCMAVARSLRGAGIVLKIIHKSIEHAVILAFESQGSRILDTSHNNGREGGFDLRKRKLMSGDAQGKD